MRWLRGIFYGWYMVALAALLMAVAGAPMWISLPAWHPLSEGSFSWDQPTPWWFSAVPFWASVLLLPALGRLVDKLGPRRMVLCGLITVGLAFALGSLIQGQLYVVFGLLALGAALSGWLPMMTMLNNWFARRKTIAMAAALVGGGLLGAILWVLLALAVGSAAYLDFDLFRWGPTALVIGLVYLAAAFPLSRLVRDRPEDMGLLPDGDAPPATDSVQATSGGFPTPETDGGHTWREAIKTKPFWLMALGYAAATATLGTLPAWLVTFLDDRGYPVATFSEWSELADAVAVVFLLVGGYLGDKFSMTKMAFAFSAVLAVAVVLLVLAPGTGMVLAFAVLFGIASGGSFAIMISMIGRYFGRKAFATMIGILLVPPALMLVASSMMVGIMQEYTGSLGAAFLILAPIPLVGGIAFLMMREPAGRAPLISERSAAAAI